MQEILNILSEMWVDENLSDEQIIEIYNATTEEERVIYMETIQDLLDNIIVPDNIHELCSAVSYLNIENFVLKNKLWEKVENIL